MFGDVTSKFPKEFSFSEGFLKDFQKEVTLFLKKTEAVGLFKGKPYDVDSLFSNYKGFRISKRVFNNRNICYTILISKLGGTNDYLYITVDERVTEGSEYIKIAILQSRGVPALKKNLRSEEGEYARGIEKVINLVRKPLVPYLDSLVCSFPFSKEYFSVSFNSESTLLALNSHSALYFNNKLDTNSILKLEVKKVY